MREIFSVYKVGSRFQSLKAIREDGVMQEFGGRVFHELDNINAEKAFCGVKGPFKELPSGVNGMMCSKCQRKWSKLLGGK